MSQQEKVAASLAIHAAADMTAEERKAIADWLRRHARDLVKKGDKYAKRFSGRYFRTPAAHLAQ